MKDKISHRLKETEKLEKQLQGSTLEEVKSKEEIESSIKNMKSDLSKLLSRTEFYKKILFPFIFLVAISYVFLIARYSMVSIANDRNTKFKNRITVLSVYLSDLEIKRLKAEWTQMRTNNDFNKIGKTIDEYYQKLNIK